mgnify:CR=1 FL=1
MKQKIQQRVLIKNIMTTNRKCTSFPKLQAFDSTNITDNNKDYVTNNNEEKGQERMPNKIKL